VRAAAGLFGLVCALGVMGAGAADLQVRVENASATSLADAIVYAVPVTPAVRTAPAKATIDQVNRQFVPRVSVVQTGASIEFPNSDNIRHAVYSFSPAKTFTLKLYAEKPANPVVFDKSGVVVLGCTIHDHMIAWVVVVDTPYFGHTDQSGAATLAALPPGDYRLYAWHEPMADPTPGEALHVEAAPQASRTVRLDVPAQ
jgi:plastocyanin